MILQLECVDAFHKRLGVSPTAEWESFGSTYGHSLLNMAKSLEPLVNESGPALRAHLLLEELGEYLIANTEVLALDALTDLLYVLLGTALMYEWPLEEAFSEVHASNMTKVKQPDDELQARVRKKGDDYKPPRIKEVLDNAKNGVYDKMRRQTARDAVRKLHDAFFKGNETDDDAQSTGDSRVRGRIYDGSPESDGSGSPT